LLLDEPTAGVDPKARREFWDEIHALAAEGMTVLVSTHYMDEAERCHEIAYIAYGKLLAQGTVEEIITQSGLTRPGRRQVRAGPLDRVAADASGQSRRRAAPFGATLHVCRPDKAALGESLEEIGRRDGITAKPGDRRWRTSSST
jgi:ABC-2 type transport system ATP-binding protein